MARNRMPSINVIFALAFVALAGLVAAQVPSSAPAPSLDCTNSLLNLSPCLDYVQGNDSKPPPKDCCSGLAQVVNSNEICLCQLFGATNPFGLTINQTRAMAMPTLCKVQTLPLSTCNAVGVPVASPSTSTSGLSPLSSPGTPSSSPSAGLPGAPSSSPSAGLGAGATTPSSTGAATPSSSTSAGAGSAGSIGPSGVSVFTALLFAALFTAGHLH